MPHEKTAPGGAVFSFNQARLLARPGHKARRGLGFGRLDLDQPDDRDRHVVSRPLGTLAGLFGQHFTGLPGTVPSHDGAHLGIVEISPEPIRTEHEGIPPLRRMGFRKIENRGIVAPRDVSLVVADDDPSFAWCNPIPSHIRWDYRPVVRHVVRWAKNVASGKEDRRTFGTESEFVKGGTIGPVPVGRQAR